MELRHLRYFVAVGEEQHYGRAAKLLFIAQPALSRQIQDLEKELGFKLFERLPRGVKLTTAGQQFLIDARHILREVNEAVLRADRLARGQSGILRIGFLEHTSWTGVVPNSFRRFREQRPSVELQLQPATTLQQLDAIRSGRLDAGFLNNPPKGDAELNHHFIRILDSELALPAAHPLNKLKTLRLRDLKGANFIWYPRSVAPFFFDLLLTACVRGGMGSPRIVQEGLNESTTLSFVSAGMGLGWVSVTARDRCPKGVVIRPVVDLSIPLRFCLVWKKSNMSPLLDAFIQEVKSVAGLKATAKK